MQDERRDRKAWSRPELLILVRSRPEEAVLESCKVGATSLHIGPTNSKTACLSPLESCASCSADSPS